MPEPTYITSVDLTPTLRLVLYRARWRGHDYARWRLWRRHAISGDWYPSKWHRGSVRLEAAERFADGLRAAVRGEPLEPEPGWLRDAYAVHGRPRH